MTTVVERREMIARLRELPARLEAAVGGLSDAQLDEPEGEGEWSVRQVVHHLADANMNGFIRMKLVLTEEKPILKPYDQEKWAQLPDTTRVPIELSLEILRGLHERWSALLEGLPESAWQRSGVHLENGLQTLDDLLFAFVGHGENHLQQIAKIRSAHRR
jgi:uncharacterized damage-inducible protein DinB